MQIRTKQQFYRLYEQGAFGNKLRTWMGVNALVDSVANGGFHGTVSVRATTFGGDKLASYNVPASEAYRFLRSRDVHDMQRVAFNESAPDQLLVLQGEIQNLDGVLHLRYSRVRGKKMRDAMKTALHKRGLAALHLLRAVMDPSSFADLEALWELYPTAVVEFGTYSQPVGCLGGGRNSVFWEVRNY
jgi:hypothetical protein